MDLPVMPPVDPMLAKAAPNIPVREFSYEPKWDGFRCIAFRDGDDVLLGSRNTKPMDRYFPEVVEAVRSELPQRCVVDGEIVVAQGGRLEFEVLQQRVHPAESRVRMLSIATPASLVVFDIFALGDDDLTGRPLRERQQILDGLGLAGPSIHATPRSADPEVAERWFNTFEGAGLDGVVAKDLNGTYQPGKRAMVKVKHARTADVVLAGYRLHKTSTADAPLIGSLLLGLYDAAGLQFVGAVASFTAARRAQLVEELADLIAPDPAAAGHPWASWQSPGGERMPGAASRWTSGKDMSFVALRPERVLEVGYDHMEGNRFRHTAQFVRWRPDRDPASCTYEQLAEPVRYDLGEILPGAPGIGVQ